MNWQHEKVTNLTLNLGGGIYKLQTFCEKKQALNSLSVFQNLHDKRKTIQFLTIQFSPSSFQEFN